MQDFDAIQAETHAARIAEIGERPFKFRGEVFYVQANVGYLSIKSVAALSDSSSGVETFDAIERSVLSMIEPRDDAEARFNNALRDKEFPVTFDDLVQLQNWLIQEQSGVPPTKPEPSSSTPTPTGADSTETSSTELEGASTSST
jgi:hypothetical protein